MTLTSVSQIKLCLKYLRGRGNRKEEDPLFAHLVQADLWLLGIGAKVTLG